MTIPRDLLQRVFPGEPRLVRELEQQGQAIKDTAAVAAQGVAETAALDQASVITLSPNATFANEYVLKVGYGLEIEANAGVVELAVSLPLYIVGSYRLSFALDGETNVRLPQTGTLATLDGAETLTNKTLDRLRLDEAVAPSTATATHAVRVTIGGTDYMMLLTEAMA